MLASIPRYTKAILKIDPAGEETDLLEHCMPISLIEQARRLCFIEQASR